MRTSGVIPSTMAIVIGCGGAWLAAQQSPAEQLPAFRTGVEAVSVEVGVVDRQGQPVRDLRPGDFTVSVDGQPRHVVTAEFVDASASTNMMAVPDPAAISTNDGAGVGRMVMFIVNQDTLDLGSARQVARSVVPLFSRA